MPIAENMGGSIASDLIERLTRTKQIGVMELSGIPIVDDVNPDGREAAEALSQLTREVDARDAALKQVCAYVREAIDDGALDAIVALDAIDAVACEALSGSSGDAQ